ncbi:MAG: accessory factor UbiK family protein [Hahellaceae bacterium]|nr:accessory factor UbiK family protein [Hahellaceae bacterium]MCP5209666.1 accessory factor UbiK family protein [Hahellaceae bacterium]
MLTPQQLFSAINDQIGQVLPGVAKHAQEDFHNHLKIVVASVLSKLDLVTREEFDTQVEVLRKTREKVERLEKVVAELEAQSGSKA